MVALSRFYTFHSIIMYLGQYDGALDVVYHAHASGPGDNTPATIYIMKTWPCHDTAAGTCTPYNITRA